MAKFPIASMRLRHGEHCVCPACGTMGRFESVLSRDKSLARFPDWVKYEADFGEFQCHQCSEYS